MSLSVLPDQLNMFNSLENKKLLNTAGFVHKKQKYKQHKKGASTRETSSTIATSKVYFEPN